MRFALVAPATALVIASGCQAGTPSNADSLAAASASSTPAHISVPDSGGVTAAGGVSITPATGKQATTRPKATAVKSSGSTGTRTPAPVDTTIIGWDSVIRGPIRALPTVSSTPRRD
ncbi:MAG TPA: hypothetical protein VFS56_12925 [Gemmatimonadaceae bacterium]|nr:hypothetical protein [Gemmatimonadaceae bacterium]